MKRTVFMFALVLMTVLLISIPCSALTPTPTPVALTASPTPTPILDPAPTPLLTDSSGNHIHLSVSGLASEPPKHLLYSHENGIMADGFLMFMPLATYVEREQIPVISRGQFLSARITFDVYVESFSCSTDFYRKTEAGLEGLGSIDLSVSDLQDAPYLVKMDCSAVHHGEAFRFFYLFWVE